jgi:hypothetical protein
VKLSFVCSTLALWLLGSSLQAAIIGIEEVNPDEMAAIIETNFGEDSLAFSDRTHQHNSAAFNDAGVLSTTGTNILPLPSYLLGQDYIRFANDAKTIADYSATITTDEPSNFWLLVDNRMDGAAGNVNSPNSTDPVLEGALQWVVDGGWVRLNTGISPNGQADYTGVDEGGEGVGPGVGLNQFYSVYTLPTLETSVTVHGVVNGGNFISLIAGKQFTPGDFNGDGNVDGMDFTILSNNLGGHLDGPVGRENGDMNFDGRVDLDDFGLFKGLPAGGAAIGQGQAIPEPSSIVLVCCVLGALSLGYLRKRGQAVA